MSIADLRKAQRAYDAIAERYEAARRERDRVLVAELAAGTKQADIMAATGLSRARLAQIKRGTR
jgi:hypothetical protein